MKRRLKPIVTVLAALTCSSLALASTHETQLTNQLHSVNVQMQHLQQQMQQLQTQVRVLKAREKSKQVKSRRRVMVQHKAKKKHSKTARPFALHPLGTADKQYMPFGNSVIIAPFVGVPTYYNGHQLVVNSPSINEDEKLLRRRDTADALILKKGGDPYGRPRLTFSGALSGVTQYMNPYRGSARSEVDFTQAELDTFVEVSRWVSGLMAFTYQNAPEPLLSANRVDNSRIVLSKGFITIGNLLKSPVFGSLGQMYVPFGRYSSSMVSSPLTEFIGKTKVRAISVSYRPGGLSKPYAEAFIFSGAANSSNSRLEDVGADAGYDFTRGTLHANLGVSYINQIADALGMQDTGASSGFRGFNQNSQTEKMNRKVQGGDVHGVFGYGPVTLIAEYVTALRRFAFQNLSFNSRGARPSAFNGEAAFNFFLLNKPSSFAVGYALSRQALALGLPRSRYSATVEMAILRDTLFSVEYRHDINYGKHDTATGAGMNAVPDARDLGKSDNVVTAQLSVYF
jgi:hypothetical protein